MKPARSLPLLAAMFCSAPLLAQAPHSFSYQAVMRDQVTGQPMANQQAGVSFTLHQGSAAGTVVYAEQHSTTANDQGLFTLQVGGGTPTSGTFNPILWRNGPYFLEVGLDVGSTGIFTTMGTQQLLSVPYALYAESSNIPDGTEVGEIAHWDGTTWVVDSGLYVHQKRFGIGLTEPTFPLGIKAEPGQEDRMLSFESADGDQKWNINLNPSGGDVAGFSIDDASSGIGNSRLFIAPSTGHVGIGTTDPGAPLSIRSRADLYEEFKNGDIPDQDDFRLSSGGGTGLSFDQDTTGGTASRLFIQSGTGHIGIGTQDPPAPLAIETRAVLKQYFQTGNTPAPSDFAFTSDSSGFGIDQGIPGSLMSRMFIDASTGNVGVGTSTPTEKFFIHAIHAGDRTGLGLHNGAVTANAGWAIAHMDDAVPARIGAFSLLEKDAVADSERITVLPGGNVGINEQMPHATLHVSRPITDPEAPIALAENTGIAVLGPITDNIVADYRGIQARHGEYIGPVLDLQVADLNLQRLGGNTIFHGASSSESDKVVITSDGRVGVGVPEPSEKLHVNGAIVIGNTTTAAPIPGSIRFNGTNFETWNVGDWAIFNGSVWEKVDNTDDIVYADGTTPRVGIGTSTVNATLHVHDSNASPGNTVRAAIIHNSSTTTSTSQDDHRIGLEITNSGAWGGDPLSKNIGLYVKGVSGQSNANSNLAAVLNGNTVIGDLVPSSAVVGTGGTNVLAIQNGSAPSSIPGSTPNSGIQIFSDATPGSGSAFHLMNGDGSVIKLYRAPAITMADESPVGPGVDPSTAALIENMRTRINELENVLKNLGLLTP